MKKALFACLFAPSLAFSQKIQLAPPQLKLASGSGFFFENQAEARLVFDLEGAEIRFTLDGTEPTERSPRADGPILLNEKTDLRAAVFHPDFAPSEAKKWAFEKLNPEMRPDSVVMAKLPDFSYPPNASALLFDLKTGSATNFQDPNWLGLEGRSAVVLAFFEQKKRISRIRVHGLVDEKSWVFPPKTVSVSFPENRKSRTQTVKITADPSQKGAFFFDLKLKKPVRTKLAYLIILPFGALPKGHAGEGKSAWLFLDEIVFEK